MARFTQEQLLEAYRRAPEAIQDTYGSELMAGVINDIKTRFRLHVDVVGSIEREVGYLMLGLISPAEFFGSLMLSGTDEQSARGIMEEVNQRIFIPLKRRMSGVTQAPVMEGTYANTPERPVREPAVPTPALDYEAPATLPGSPVAAPMPLAVSTPPSVVVSESSPISMEAPKVTPAAETTGSPAPAGNVANNTYTPPTFIASPAAPRASAPVQPVSVPVQPKPESPLKKEGWADPYREPI